MSSIIQLSLRMAQKALYGIEGAIMLQYSVLAERAYEYSMANGPGSGRAYYREMFKNPRGDERELLRAIYTRKDYRASFDQIIQATGRSYLDMKAHIGDLEVFIRREESLIALRGTGILPKTKVLVGLLQGCSRMKISKFEPT